MYENNLKITIKKPNSIQISNEIPYENIGKYEKYKISTPSKLLLSFLPSYFTSVFLLKNHPFIFLYTNNENLYKIHLKKKMKLRVFNPSGFGGINNVVFDSIVLDIDDIKVFNKLIHAN